MDRLGGRQVAFNAASRGQWEEFADHRRCLTRELARGAAAGSRLCVLGAGNANDLDLPALLRAHQEVHLVDIDAAALAPGAERQRVAGHPRLRLHGGLDVTAALGLLSGWTPLPRSAPRTSTRWPHGPRPVPPRPCPAGSIAWPRPAC